MANKTILIIILALFTSPVVHPQKLVLSPEINYGTFNMNDLKVLLDSHVSSNGIDIRNISSFPPYWGYGLSFLCNLESGFGLGIISEFYSTGGRDYYEDYSGSYKYDLLVKCFNFGVKASYNILPLSSHAVILEVSQGLKLSSLYEHESLLVTPDSFDEHFNWQSSSYWLKPVIRYEYSFTKSISAGIYFGGEFNLPSYLHMKENKDIYLTDEKHHKISINWSGIRCGLNCSFRLATINHR